MIMTFSRYFWINTSNGLTLWLRNGSLCVIAQCPSWQRVKLKGKWGKKVLPKGTHRRESQNTNHCTCQGCNGHVWHLLLFWYSSAPLQNLLCCPAGLIGCLPSLKITLFNSHLAILELLLATLPSPPAAPPCLSSFSIDLSTQSVCADQQEPY